MQSDGARAALVALRHGAADCLARQAARAVRARRCSQVPVLEPRPTNRRDDAVPPAARASPKSVMRRRQSARRVELSECLRGDGEGESARARARARSYARATAERGAGARERRPESERASVGAREAAVSHRGGGGARRHHGARRRRAAAGRVRAAAHGLSERRRHSGAGERRGRAGLAVLAARTGHEALVVRLGESCLLWMIWCRSESISSITMYSSPSSALRQVEQRVRPARVRREQPHEPHPRAACGASHAPPAPGLIAPTRSSPCGEPFGVVLGFSRAAQTTPYEPLPTIACGVYCAGRSLNCWPESLCVTILTIVLSLSRALAACARARAREKRAGLRRDPASNCCRAPTALRR